MGNFTDPIKAAFGRYMGDFYSQLITDTSPMVEFADRGLAKSIVWAPGRMVDQVEEMIAAWRKNDTSGADQPTPFVPVMIAAMAKDYLPAPPEYARAVGGYVDVMIPGDVKERVFRMRAVVAEIRTQVVVVAPEDSTARSLALQLHAFASATENRRFYSHYPLAGLSEPWPVVMQSPDMQAVSSPTDAKNLTILTVDITMFATVPLLSYPKAADPNDGKGSGTFDDPDGYLVVGLGDLETGLAPDLLPAATWTVGGL